ncbi:hypothetical protein [Candidatus Aalborgicola defluviihabitans]|uniref:hypothetical protein n=1 Tax=Candidatus Aalborgicola defluviihabitans TaxID=3386187 RepID=UPI0039B8362B
MAFSTRLRGTKHKKEGLWSAVVGPARRNNADFTEKLILDDEEISKSLEAQQTH